MDVPTNFDLGQIVGTPGALALLTERGMTPGQLIGRHARGDWGTIDPEDRGLNEQAIQTGARIFSVYPVGDQTIWIITDAADDDGRRAATTILLPEDY